MEKIAINEMQDNEYLIWEKRLYNNLVDYLNEDDAHFGEMLVAFPLLKITWEDIRQQMIKHNPKKRSVISSREIILNPCSSLQGEVRSCQSVGKTLPFI